MDTVTAFACAAWLLGYTGELPRNVCVVPFEPSRELCNAAIAPEREWFEAHNKKPMEEIRCHAVTGRYGRTEISQELESLIHDCRLGDITIFIPDTANRWVQTVEAIKAINMKRRVKMPSSEVYALADQWEQCPAP